MRLTARFLSLFLVGVLILSSRGGDVRSAKQLQRQKVASNYAQLPLSFEPNQGQADPSVKFLTRAGGGTVLLGSNEAMLSIGKPAADHPSPGSVHLKLIDADPAPRMTALDELPGKTNYFIGSDPGKWRTNVPTYSKVRYDDVYPGIDVVYYGNQQQLEYDFVVKPGADPGSIALRFSGMENMDLDGAGDVVLHTSEGDIRQHKPTVYQEVKGMRKEIAGGYVVKDAGVVGFEVPNYDKRLPLIIDPSLSYSTYFGGGLFGDLAFGTAVDSSGNVYVAGASGSGLTTTNGAVQTGFAGGDASTFGSGFAIDAFVTKFNASGSAVVYSTYLGGSGDDSIYGGIALDSAGNAYVAGRTDSPNFPVTNGALKVKFTGGQCMKDGMPFPCLDAFVAKLNSSGSALVYSTYLGGSDIDAANSIAVDSSGNAYVAGVSLSADFPTTAGAYQTTNNSGTPDGFVAKLNSLGSSLLYSTLIGGSSGDDIIQAITIDSAGSAYIAGNTRSSDFPKSAGAVQTSLGGDKDAFVAKLDPAGSSLIFSTYLGGADSDEANNIAVDASGNVYVTGGTQSFDFPKTAGSRPFAGTTSGCNQFGFTCGDAFVTKLNPLGCSMVYSVLLGGNGGEEGFGLQVNGAGEVYVSGFTNSSNFPLLSATQATRGGNDDAFVAALSSSGSISFSTFLGGGADDLGFGLIADGAGNVYLAGSTFSADFPTKTPLQQSLNGLANAFVMKLSGFTPGTGGTSANNTCTAPGNVNFLLTNGSSGGQVSMTSGGLGPLTVGYGRILTTNGTTPEGVAIFDYRQGGVLVSEAGVPASPLIQSGRIYAAVSSPLLDTGLAIANPNNSDATVTFYFTDQAGTNFGSGQTVIPANGQLARFLDQAPYNGSGSINGTFTFNSDKPIGVIALRGLLNERNEFLITTLPVAPATAGSADTGAIAYFPHFADGGGWTTQIVLVNPTDVQLNGIIQFWGQGGTQAAAPVNVTIGGQTASSFVYAIPPRTSQRFQTSGTPSSTQVGSVRATPATPNDKTPSGLAIFSYRNFPDPARLPNGVVVSEAGVPASRTALAYRMYVELGAGINSNTGPGSILSGLAVTNSSSSDVRVTFSFTSSSGVILPPAQINVAANGQAAMFLNQIPGFGSLQPPFQAVLRISTSALSPAQGISVVGLRGRYNERGEFLITTTPPVNETILGTVTDLVFPHIADGGGYTTQFILFSGLVGQSSSGNLRLLSTTGQGLNMILR